jgi:hypothetical protein
MINNGMSDDLAIDDVLLARVGILFWTIITMYFRGL